MYPRSLSPLLVRRGSADDDNQLLNARSLDGRYAALKVGAAIVV